MNPKKIFSFGLTWLVGGILAGSVSAQSYGGYINVDGRNASACWQPVHLAVCYGVLGPITDFLFQSDITKGGREVAVNIHSLTGGPIQSRV